MKILESVLVLIVGLFPLPSSLYAQTITRDELLDQLRQVHPLFEREKLTAQIERENRNSYLGAEDWNVFSSVNFSHEKPAIAFGGPSRTDALSANGGVERLFWNTGGRLSGAFSTRYARMKVTPGLGIPDSYYHHQFAVTYTHPLMQNKDGFLDKFEYELKQFDIDFSEVQALENQENLLVGAADKFLDWVLLTEQRKIVSGRLKLSEEEVERTERKRKAHLVDKVDVIRAEDAVRFVKQNQMLVESQWKSLQAELAVLSQNDEIYNLSPQFDIYRVEELISLEEAILKLKENSRIIKVLNIRLEQLGYSRKGFQEILKPQLSAVAQFNIKNADDGFGGSLKVYKKPDVIIGLQLGFPLGNRTTKSQIASTDLKIAQLEKQIDELVVTLSSSLTNLYIQIRELEGVLKLNQEQIGSAKEKTEEELRLYNQGRGNLTFVIQSRDNEENAKLTYAQNAAFYHKLILRYHALLDEILISE